jgi:hypothetical protein
MTSSTTSSGNTEVLEYFDILQAAEVLAGGESWRTWRAVVAAAFGEPLTDAELAIFSNVAGGRSPPTKRVRELWAVVGRRAGKSRMASVLAVYLALFQRHELAVGEVGTVLVVAATQQQAGVVFRYIEGLLRASPVLARSIAGSTASEIRLKNRAVISVLPASFRSIRGRTIVAAVFDEVSFWRDETSTLPDVEVYRAVLPALIASGGMLISISTPYRKLGLLHQKHRDYHGVDDPSVLVVAGDSRTFNPLLDEAEVAQAMADDPEAASSEWGGTFRRDISAFLDDAVIEAAVDRARPLELPPRPGLTYVAFVDASGGRGDAYTIAIGHKEQDRVIADVVRGRRPPFDPQQVTAEFAQLAKQYRVRRVVGDNYSAEWVSRAFGGCGLIYERADLPRSGLYVEGLPLFMRSLVSIPDHAPLLRELRLLERRVSRLGRDTIDHGRNGSDDHANAVFGMLRCATRPVSRLRWAPLTMGPPPAKGHERRSRVVRLPDGGLVLRRREPDAEQERLEAQRRVAHYTKAF